MIVRVFKYFLPFGLLIVIKKIFHRAERYVYINFHNKKIIRDYFKVNKIRKLHIGCGDNLLDNWINTDFYPDKKKAFLDVSEKFPFKSHEFDYIFCEHLIEHLSFREGSNTLCESFRILKPEGKIRISTPDLRYLMDIYSLEKTDIQRQEMEKFVNTFFCEAKVYQDAILINTLFYKFGHKFIYDFKVLENTLLEAGFVNIHRCDIGQSSDKELCNLESHGKFIGEEFNKLHTMTVEAQKPLDTKSINV